MPHRTMDTRLLDGVHAGAGRDSILLPGDYGISSRGHGTMHNFIRQGSRHEPFETVSVRLTYRTNLRWLISGTEISTDFAPPYWMG